MSISPRTCRTASTKVLIHSTSASAAGSGSPGSGQGWSMIVSPSIPAAGATRRQRSSVRNGMRGCRNLSRVSSTSTRVRRVAARAASGTSGPASTGLVSSRYQSQNSFQVKS